MLGLWVGALRRALGVGLVAAALGFFGAAAPAYAKDAIVNVGPAAKTQLLPKAMVGAVRVARAAYSGRATAYEWRPSRLGDGDESPIPIAYEPAVRVEIVVADPAPDRLAFDFADGATTLAFYVAPDALTPSQRTALQGGNGDPALFPVRTRQVSVETRRLVPEQSQLCDSDQLRCEEHLVYETAQTEMVEISLADS